jgi:signal transduction histidine kinase
MHPLVSTELGRVAEEALLNIVRHARANSVEITVRFSARQLELEVRDDGVGLTAEVLEKGQKSGHFGLIGMRERTQRVGGTFAIESRPGRGSAVSVSVPARLAFADRAGRKFFSKLFAPPLDSLDA